MIEPVALMLPAVAVMVLIPRVEPPVATPVLALMAATAGLLELQVATVGELVPSEKVPIAVKVAVLPVETVAWAGETVRLARVGTVTVTVVELVMVPCAAVMVVTPPARPVTRPAALTEATAGVPEVHVAEVVRSFEVPSE
jgi:hypothetical protein